MIALSPEHGLAHFQLGRAFQKMNRSQEAIRTYRTGLRIFPENSKAYNNLGNIYSGQGDFDQAQTAYEQAVFWQSDYALAYNNLGDLLAYKKRDLKSAAQQFGNALQYQPDFPAALFNLGNIRLAEKNEAQAFALFQQALRVDPNYVPALGNLSVLFIGRGENEAARKHLNHLLQIAPGDQRARDLLERLDQSEQK
ncbi:MAG: tetratricopeptide repeat protein [bacterium]|nr:tetratricopeptide repeat protein [bacterium]